jgi:hypothetical protein
MRTFVDIERLGTGKWRLRVHRADRRGNVIASASVDGELSQVHALANDSIRAWALADEIAAHAEKAIRSRGR